MRLKHLLMWNGWALGGVVLASLVGCMLFIRPTRVPDLAATWKGVTYSVEVIDEKDEVHEVVGVELQDASQARIIHSRKDWANQRDEDAEALFWCFWGDAPRIALLVDSGGRLISAADYPRVNNTVTISGTVGFASENPMLPVVDRRAMRLSDAARITYNDGSTKASYASISELVIEDPEMTFAEPTPEPPDRQESIRGNGP